MVVLKLPLPPPDAFNPQDPFGLVESPAVLEGILFPKIEWSPEQDGRVETIYEASEQEIAVDLRLSRYRLYYHFDRSLNLLRMSASDLYRVDQDALFREGKLGHAFGASDVEVLSRLFRCQGRTPNGNSEEVAAFFARAAEAGAR